jgi:hypothetical protein
MTNGRDLRALYGVCACAAQLAGVRGSGGGGGGSSRGGGGGGGGDGDAGQAAAELGKVAGEALVQRYALSRPDKLPLVKAMLAAQGLS